MRYGRQVIDISEELFDLARTILAPVILPVGIMTSFLGVPFFVVYLFMRRRRT